MISDKTPLRKLLLLRKINDIISYAGVLKTVNGSEITISDALAKNADSIVIAINMVQQGSGIPSPSNVRNISGRNLAKITINGKNINTSLGRNVYGGTIDLISGELKITHKVANFNGDEDGWTYASNSCYIINPSQLEGCKIVYDAPSADAKIYQSEYLEAATWKTHGSENCIYGRWNNNPCLEVKMANIISSKNDFVEYVHEHPLKVVFELAQPEIITIDPQVIRLSVGENTLASQTGSITLKYYAQE